MDSLARIYAVHKEFVRTSLESIFILSVAEWYVEESVLNFVDKGILQKFINNKFM